MLSMSLTAEGIKPNLQSACGGTFQAHICARHRTLPPIRDDDHGEPVVHSTTAWTAAVYGGGIGSDCTHTRGWIRDIETAGN